MITRVMLGRLPQHGLPCRYPHENETDGGQRKLLGRCLLAHLCFMGTADAITPNATQSEFRSADCYAYLMTPSILISHFLVSPHSHRKGH